MQGVYDNERFRLPTNVENASDYDYARLVGSYGQPGYGIRLGEDNATFLPATGHRGIGGESDDVWSLGFFWSSKPDAAMYGYAMNFSGDGRMREVANNGCNAHYGYAVRCVPR